jgi:CysZ protein
MPGVLGEFGLGVGLLGRGLGLIVRRPRLFLLGALPPLATSVLFVALLAWLFSNLRDVVGWLTPFADGLTTSFAAIVRTAVAVTLAGGAVLLMVLTFTTLTLTIGSPLYDKVSEFTEREFGPVPQLSEPLVTGVLRALRQTVGLIAVSLVGALVLFGAGFLPVVGQTVVPVASALFGGWMLTIELVGGPFERRGRLRLADRRAAMRGRRARVLGFAIPTFLLLAIPFAGAVVFPVATVGGTLLARQLLGEPT